MPAPAGGLLILSPLIFELVNLDVALNIKQFTPYFTVFVAFLLVSKIPTLSLKKNFNITQSNNIYVAWYWNNVYFFVILYF